MTNPFVDIEPKDKAPENLKKEVMKSIDVLKMVMRVSEHFTSIFGITVSEKMNTVFKTDIHEKEKD